MAQRLSKEALGKMLNGFDEEARYKRYVLGALTASTVISILEFASARGRSTC